MPAAEIKLKPRAAPSRKPKHNYIGAPAIFALEQACSLLVQSFDTFGVYLVGSAIERPDWRDVDLRMILADEEFKVLFPTVASIEYPTWEHDQRWLLLTVSISQWLSQQSGLPVDFQFQPQTFANKSHAKPRHAMGLRYARATHHQKD